MCVYVLVYLLVAECRTKIEEDTEFSQLAASFIDPHLGQNPLY